MRPIRHYRHTEVTEHERRLIAMSPGPEQQNQPELLPPPTTARPEAINKNLTEAANSQNPTEAINRTVAQSQQDIVRSSNEQLRQIRMTMMAQHPEFYHEVTNTQVAANTGVAFTHVGQERLYWIDKGASLAAMQKLHDCHNQWQQHLARYAANPRREAFPQFKARIAQDFNAQLRPFNVRVVDVPNTANFDYVVLDANGNPLPPAGMSGNMPNAPAGHSDGNMDVRVDEDPTVTAERLAKEASERAHKKLEEGAASRNREKQEGYINSPEQKNKREGIQYLQSLGDRVRPTPTAQDAAGTEYTLDDDVGSFASVFGHPVFRFNDGEWQWRGSEQGSDEFVSVNEKPFAENDEMTNDWNEIASKLGDGNTERAQAVLRRQREAVLRQSGITDETVAAQFLEALENEEAANEGQWLTLDRGEGGWEYRIDRTSDTPVLLSKETSTDRIFRYETEGEQGTWTPMVVVSTTPPEGVGDFSEADENNGVA